MTYAEYQEYMRNFFEQYYQKLSQEEIRVTLPLEEEEKEMWSDDVNPNDEWKKWKLVPAMISDGEIKKLEKEGFKTPVGKLPLAKQLETAWEKQAELDTEGNPYWYIASSRAVGGNQSAAALQATNAAKIDLAGQIQTKVSQLIEAKVANDDMGQEEAASLSSVVASSKSVISATLGRTIPLVEVYKTLPNKNVEVMVTIGYSMQSANQAAVQAIRKELAAKSEELAKQLDKLGY